MTEERKEPVARKDREWLLGELVELFQDASRSEEKDHAVCVKYADLLYKLLPTGAPKSDDDPLDRVRKRVMGE